MLDPRVEMSRNDDTIPVGRPPTPPAPGAPDDQFAPGALVGDYVVERLLARGGHGAVYVAEHRVLGRRVAVKVLRRELAGSDEMLARFTREARVVNRIRHPHIVDIYDIGRMADGRPFCVMEMLDGRGLDAVLRERGALPLPLALAILAPVCEALEAAHQAGVVHRDVKASNVLVLEGEPTRVKLLDFGIAKAVEPGQEGITTMGQRLGTMVAMAPEQIAGAAVDARADVYALGVLLFHMLTGRLPFSAPTLDEVERMHLEAPPPRPSELAPVPRALDAVVVRCMEKVPERRYPSASAVLEAAREAAGSGPAQPLRRRPALGVHVLLRLPEDPDEEALVAQAEAADQAEAALREAGFDLPVSTGGSLLGVRLLSEGEEEARQERSETARRFRDLTLALSRPGIEVSVTVHVAEAEVRDTSGGPEIAGGPVCRTQEWVEEPAGFHVTPAAMVR